MKAESNSDRFGLNLSSMGFLTREQAGMNGRSSLPCHAPLFAAEKRMHIRMSTRGLILGKHRTCDPRPIPHSLHHANDLQAWQFGSGTRVLLALTSAWSGSCRRALGTRTWSPEISETVRGWGARKVKPVLRASTRQLDGTRPAWRDAHATAPASAHERPAKISPRSPPRRGPARKQKQRPRAAVSFWRLPLDRDPSLSWALVPRALHRRGVAVRAAPRGCNRAPLGGRGWRDGDAGAFLGVVPGA